MSDKGVAYTDGLKTTKERTNNANTIEEMIKWFFNCFNIILKSLFI